MATKKAINQAIAQANAATASKFLAVMRNYINDHWTGTKQPSVVQKRFLSANHRLLRAAYKHDVLGYKGDMQEGRWSPRMVQFGCAPLKVANGSLTSLPFCYNRLTHCHYLIESKMDVSVMQWAKRNKVSNGDVFTIVYIALSADIYAPLPAYYKFHSADRYGYITLRCSDTIRKDRRRINQLTYNDLFDIDVDYRDNFNFPLTQPFTLHTALGYPDWVIWRQGFGFETIGAWAICHSRKSGRYHSSTVLNLENQRFFGLDYEQMLNEYL